MGKKIWFPLASVPYGEPNGAASDIIAELKNRGLLRENEIQTSLFNMIRERVKTAINNHVQDELCDPKDIYEALIHGNSPYAVHLFGWVDYHKGAFGYRLKVSHDIKMKDGVVHLGCRPNADSWHLSNGKVVKDKDVKEIRLSKTLPYLDTTWKHPGDKGADKNETDTGTQ